MNFVLFSPRHGADVAASELYDFMSASGLQPHELEQRMLDSESAELGDLHGIDGIFVGGSPHTVTNPQKDEEQKHVERLLRALTGTRIPVINICFGAHVLAPTALTMDRAKGIDVHTVEDTANQERPADTSRELVAHVAAYEVEAPTAPNKIIPFADGDSQLGDALG